MIRTPGQVKGMDDIGRIVVSREDGAPITSQRYRRCQHRQQFAQRRGDENGEEVVLGTVFMLIGENSREVSRRVAAKIDEVNRSLPDGVIEDHLRSHHAGGQNHRDRVRKICWKVRCW